MKKLIFGGVMFFSGFLGFLSLMLLFGFKSYSFSYSGSRLFALLKESNTTFPFIIFLALTICGAFISWKSAYKEN